ncbi:hypothetical protein [uncultured Kordia sp.]|uniref:hypothetical protein n=1 Tax=uncultured Kordia sp. TaxID=507699 RepID=UPI00261C483D|nr:hypothetical protein [uncultured Kordia sp.]
MEEKTEFQTKEIIRKHEFVNGLFLFVKALIIFGILLITMEKNYFVYYKTQAIIALIVGTSFFVFVLRKNDFIAPIIALILMCFLEVVDTHLWRYVPFSYMFTVEDFSGVYEGNKISESVTKTEQIVDGYTSVLKSKISRNPSKFTLRINQTGSKISIHSFCYKNDKDKIHESKSDMMAIRELENKGDYELIYHFNDIGTPKQGRYSGTAHLNITRINDDFSIEGGFYTNRNPQTRGNFTELKKIGENSQNPFYSPRYLRD